MDIDFLKKFQSYWWDNDLYSFITLMILYFFLFITTLIHCGLVTPYSIWDLSQYRFRLWLVTWWHQAITWTYVDLPTTRPSIIYSTLISTWIFKISFPKMCLKFTHLKSQPHLLGEQWVNTDLPEEGRLQHQAWSQWNGQVITPRTVVYM